jgi:hypothetical protein
MDSTLVAVAVEELRRQRTFLSSDEASALTMPVEHLDDENLALDRVRRRRLWIFTALRDRFIRDGRPFDDWLDVIESEEAAAGGETLITQLARQVLEWSIRSSDRGTMLGGFASSAMRWIGLILLALGGWSWYQGAAPFVVGVTFVVGAALLIGAVVVGRLAVARGGRLVATLRRGSAPSS